MGQDRSYLDVVQLCLACGWGVADGPMHEPEVEVVEAQIQEGLIQCFLDQAGVMAVAISIASTTEVEEEYTDRSRAWR